jgi:hemoglobin
MSVESQHAPPEARTPYEQIGGAEVVRRITERFYDIMSDSPEAGAIRAMHAGDLAPMRQKLFEFMSGWLGGPNLYFARSDRKCMGAAHGPYVIGENERDQWLACMRRAMRDAGVDPTLRERIDAALFRIADMLRTA